MTINLRDPITGVSAVPESHDLNIHLRCDNPGYVAYTNATSQPPPFALQDLPQMEQGAPTRYDEIAKMLISYIPPMSTANFSIIHNGELWKSAQPVTYNCIFSAPQIDELTQSSAITGNIYNDDSGMLADFFAVHSTKSDQKVFLNGIFAAAKDAERNVSWRAKRNKPTKSLRSSERYTESTPSLVHALSTSVSITEKMNMWCLRSSTRNNDDMDSSSEPAGPAQ
ncbi:hypothetical protein GGU11DRAFT_757717 [Lentinula aff. detonsa]|nr:hypothetical protein GGU11DRAFT_757717 [Lentinula aff. detonsa]